MIYITFEISHISVREEITLDIKFVYMQHSLTLTSYIGKIALTTGSAHSAKQRPTLLFETDCFYTKMS